MILLVNALPMGCIIVAQAISSRRSPYEESINPQQEEDWPQLRLLPQETVRQVAMEISEKAFSSSDGIVADSTIKPLCNTNFASPCPLQWREANENERTFCLNENPGSCDIDKVDVTGAFAAGLDGLDYSSFQKAQLANKCNTRYLCRGEKQTHQDCDLDLSVCPNGFMKDDEGLCVSIPYVYDGVCVGSFMLDKMTRAELTAWVQSCGTTFRCKVAATSPPTYSDLTKISFSNSLHDSGHADKRAPLSHSTQMPFIPPYLGYDGSPEDRGPINAFSVLR